jgi:hypothetical protein
MDMGFDSGKRLFYENLQSAPRNKTLFPAAFASNVNHHAPGC